jgi:hypothetical protein
MHPFGQATVVSNAPSAVSLYAIRKGAGQALDPVVFSKTADVSVKVVDANAAGGWSNGSPRKSNPVGVCSMRTISAEPEVAEAPTCMMPTSTRGAVGATSSGIM